MYVFCSEGRAGGGVALSVKARENCGPPCPIFFFSRVIADADRGALPRWLRTDRPRDREHLGDDDKHACPTGGGSCEGEKADLRTNQRSGDANAYPHPAHPRASPRKIPSFVSNQALARTQARG